MRFWITLLLVFAAMTSNAQTAKEFTYKKKKVHGRPGFLFIHETDTMLFMSNPNTAGDMIVGMKTGGRKLVKKSDEKRIDIQLMNGGPVASLSYYKKKMYELTLTDGTKYQWNSAKKKDEWTYSQSGKQVLVCKLVKTNGIYVVQYTIASDANTELEVLELASNYVAMGRIREKATTPFIIAAGVIAGIASAASAGNNSPDVQ